jgi:putative flavoprotein involved in K+ transport
MRTETLVIGAGQAGLSASHHLSRLGREHLVVDSGAIGETWRSRRWDSFTLVTPSWSIRLPGLDRPPGDPDAFLPRAGIVSMLEDYAAASNAPIRTGVTVESLERSPTGDDLVARATDGEIQARNVIVATGFYSLQRLPPFAARLGPRILQVDSDEYRNPELLPPGGVLVVGSAQSGCQIVEDLQVGGREVWLSVGSAGRVPRTYRGRDGLAWWNDLGRFDATEDQVPDPRGRFAPNPHMTGARGGHTINLHRLARDGVRLVGRIVNGGGTRLELAPDLHERLAAVDKFAATFRKLVDDLIVERSLAAPTADPSNTDEHDGLEGFETPLVEQLDLAAAGISTIVWATGFVPDHSWIRLPVLDAAGQPIHDAGITRERGLAFVGLRFQRWAKSDLFLGVGDDARLVVERLCGKSADPRTTARMPG